MDVDFIFNVDEYIEMVMIVVDVVGFLIFLFLSDMLKIFVILGCKCVLLSFKNSIQVEEKIDENMVVFVKKYL